jgi:hypothetical protein
VGEQNLSQAEQVSQGGEPMVDRGGPFGLLGYDCRWLKLERIRQGFFRGRFWIPVRKSRTKRLTEPRKFQLQRMQTHTDLLSTHSTPVCHKMLYSNTYNTDLNGSHRRFCTIPKGQRDDNTNPGSQRLALLMSMLPSYNPTRY